MKPISEEAMREPTEDELAEAQHILEFMDEKIMKRELKIRYLAYCLREARASPIKGKD